MLNQYDASARDDNICIMHEFVNEHVYHSVPYLTMVYIHSMSSVYKGESTDYGERRGRGSSFVCAVYNTLNTRQV